jgi:hypothetical protein
MNPFIDDFEFDARSFHEWNWMIPVPATPLFLTIFGDWVYRSNDAIYLLSPTSANSFHVATIAEELDWALENISERAWWLHPEVLSELEDQCIDREYGKIFHFVTPLFLGGIVALSNLQQISIAEYFAGMQTLLRQIVR